MSSIKKHTKEEKKEENIYNYIDYNLSSMAIFNNEAKWRDFLTKAIVNGIEISPDNEQLVHIGKMRKDVALMKHFFARENHDSFVRKIAIDNGLNKEGVERLLSVEIHFHIEKLFKGKLR